MKSSHTRIQALMHAYKTHKGSFPVLFLPPSVFTFCTQKNSNSKNVVSCHQERNFKFWAALDEISSHPEMDCVSRLTSALVSAPCILNNEPRSSKALWCHCYKLGFDRSPAEHNRNNVSLIYKNAIQIEYFFYL